MTEITLKQIRRWGPCGCYSIERLSDLIGDRESITIREVLKLPIPSEDKVWIATRPGVLDDATRDAWLEVVVSRAVRNYAVNCGVAEIESWARSWLAGDEWARSRVSAATVARIATAWGMWTVDAVAWAAVRMTAGQAPEATRAARGAACLTTRGSAEVAEIEQQVRDLVNLLKASEGGDE